MISDDRYRPSSDATIFSIFSDDHHRLHLLRRSPSSPTITIFSGLVLFRLYDYSLSEEVTNLGLAELVRVVPLFGRDPAQPVIRPLHLLRRDSGHFIFSGEIPASSSVDSVDDSGEFIFSTRQHNRRVNHHNAVNPLRHVKAQPARLKTEQKSTKPKITEKPVEIVPLPQPTSTSSSFSLSSSQSAPLTMRKNDSFDNGVMSGASSSSQRTIDAHDNHDLPLDTCDLLMSNDEKSEMLEKLYCEYLNLLEDGDGV
ncbi:hypothetical protein LXL04_011669 [Taraxacum kok-saghyz]